MDLTTGTVEVFPDLLLTAVAVSPDGVLVLGDERNGGVVVVDTAGGVHRLAAWGRAVAISDDGRTISGSAVWKC